MALQSGSLGVLYVARQTAKGTAATETYSKFRANTADYAPQQMFRNIGNLVGGSFLPAGSIKTAAFSAGAWVLPPPPDNYLGWLFHAFAGSVTSNTLSDSGNYYEHYFPSGADDTAPDKYLTLRRTIPGTANQYEQMEDVRPSRLLLTLTPGEYASLRFEGMGRTISAPDGAGWSAGANAAESHTNVPISVSGGIEIPDGTSLGTATGVSVDIRNMPPDIRDVQVMGSYYPYDFPVLTRQITVDFTHLWETKTLYQNMYWDGTAWDTSIYSTSCDLYVNSTTYITGTTPYQINVWMDGVDWNCDAVPLTGAELIRVRFTGTAKDAASGYDWYLRLRNGTASYTWPT